MIKNLFKIKNIAKVFFVFLLLLVLTNTVFAQPVGRNPDGSFYNTNVFSNVTFGNTTVSGVAGSVQVCPQGIGGVMCSIQKLLNSAIPLMLTLGVVFFVWNVVQYVISDSEEAKTKGRDHMVYGIIGFAVILGLWGLVNLVVRTFNIGGQNVAIPALVPTSTAALSANACNLGSNPKFQDLVAYITCNIQNFIIPLIFAIAILFFVWNVVQYVISDSEEAKTKGRDHMIWGVIALAVMITVWQLVGILGGTFGLKTNVLPSIKPNTSN